MGQERILVDTNSYLRLAQNIHPFFLRDFGAEEFTLFPHYELEHEFKRSPRLRSKFNWFTQDDYVNDRKKRLGRTTQESVDLNLAYELMWAQVVEEGLNPSETDTFIIAMGAALNIRIVTDDADMSKLSEIYGVRQISSMELMKLMLDAGHIDMEKVQQVVAQWSYDGDLPNRHFKRDFKKIFGEEPAR